MPTNTTLSVDDRLQILATLMSAFMDELPEDGPDWAALEALAKRVQAKDNEQDNGNG